MTQATVIPLPLMGLDSLPGSSCVSCNGPLLPHEPGPFCTRCVTNAGRATTRAGRHAEQVSRDKLIAEQGGVCAACGDAGEVLGIYGLEVDRDPDTMDPLAGLCHRCKILLGQTRRSVVALKAGHAGAVRKREKDRARRYEGLIEYLKR